MSALAKSAKKQLILAGDNLLDARVQLHDVYLLPLVLLLDIGRPRLIVIILRYRAVIHQLTKFGASPPSLTAENPVVFSEHHHPKTLKTL